MPNWTAITIDNLKANGHGHLVDVARTKATGTIDPATEVIAEVVAKIRAACSTGNALDADTTKVPNSLAGLANRMVLHLLSERIGHALTPDQKETKKNDADYLKQIMAQKLRFETPDTAAGSGEMQTAGGIETTTSTNRNDYTRQGMGGLL